ncbi:MAG: peptidase MA family metallohydrolase [Anaerolineae bacterium]
MSRCPRKTSRQSNSSLRAPVRVRFALLIGLLIGVLLFGSGPADAQSDWQLLSQQTSARFSQSLDVSLRVRASEPIEDVILFYGRAGDRIVRRIYPPFGRGVELNLDYRESLERGQFAPGTELRTWWRLTDASGDTFETPVQSILYTDEAHDWRMLEGDTARLFYYDVRESKASGWLDEAESTLERIRREIGLSPERIVDIYVYRNETDMRAAVAMRSDDYDARVTTLGVAVDEDTLILLGSQANLELTMAHELSHIVVGMATDNPYAGLPRWLDEGLAMIAEGELPRQNALALERAIANDDLLSVRSMTSYSGRADQVDLYYGECHSVVSFLIDSYGRDRLNALLARFAEGTSQHSALESVYGFDIEELDALWRESLGLDRRSQTLSNHGTAGTLAARAFG